MLFYLSPRQFESYRSFVIKSSVRRFSDSLYIPIQNAGVDVEDWCSVVGPAWLRHLESFAAPLPDGSSTSYSARSEFSDHFYVNGRALHHSKNLMIMRHISDKFISPIINRQGKADFKQTDCGYRHRAFRDVHRIVLESQFQYDRGCGRTHPVPYQSLFPWRPGADWGRAWSGRREPRLISASSFFSDDDRDQSGARTAFRAGCDAWRGCEMLERNIDGTLYWMDAYRNSTYTLQPCGFSAARKGIVDSLMAGAVPIIYKEDPESGLFSVKDQRGLWPWQWAWQGAASIIVNTTDLTDLPGLIAQVDGEQLELMRRVIKTRVANMAWPANYAPLPKENDGREGTATLPNHRAQSKHRPPNALELAMHHLLHAVTESATPEFRTTCAAIEVSALEYAEIQVRKKMRSVMEVHVAIQRP